MNLRRPIVVQVANWHAVWHGGEYINVYPDAENARTDAAGGNPQTCVHSINTTGDDVSALDPEEYVRREVAEWDAEDGDDYRAACL